MTKYYRLGETTDILFSQSSGSWKSKIRMQMATFPLCAQEVFLGCMNIKKEVSLSFLI